MEESPDHGTDVIEEPEGSSGVDGVDDAGGEQDPEVGVSFFGRTKGDAEVIHPVFPGPSVPFSEIRRYRAR